jgi:tetratricopeptide (TPR) repeat protein
LSTSGRLKFSADEVGSMTAVMQPGRLLRLALVVMCGACATGGGGGAAQVGDVTPSAIPSLEAQKSQHPHDANTLARLGVAYFKAGRYQDARSVLDSAVAYDSSNGIAAIYLGMTAEQLGDFATARAAYTRYIALPGNDQLKATAQQRLALVGRRELEYQARQELTHEASLAQMPPESNTVAVMPFIYTGTDSEIQPLGRGLAQLLVTDLAKSRQIRVLERERMQAILDELKLSDSAQTDPSTALRSGHLLQAADVVQGSLTSLPGSRLRVDAAVVNVASAGVKASAGDLEKLDQNLGIQLSPAEQEAINQRPTENLQAFLAYSRGLQAEDRGDFTAAQADFNQAAVLDPGFQAAGQSAASAGQLSAASQQTVGQVATVVSSVATIQAPPPGGGVTAQQQVLNDGTNTVNNTTGSETAATTGTTTNAPTTVKNVTAEATGTEGPGPTTGTVVIIIRRPP